jgi:hypothetical protein
VIYLLTVYKKSRLIHDTNSSVTGGTARETEVKFNEELENVQDWLLAIKLTLDIEKKLSM